MSNEKIIINLDLCWFVQECIIVTALLLYILGLSNEKIWYTGLQLMFFWVGESIIEAVELGKMAPLGPANFAVRRALIGPLVAGIREGEFLIKMT